MIFYTDMLNKPFQREDSLTGRVQIWPPLVAYALDNPLLGAGFGSFWNIGRESPIFAYSTTYWVTQLGNGHNGYLDLLVQIGFPGLILVVMALIVTPMLRLSLSPYASRNQGALLLALIIFCTGHNFTETSLMDRDAFVHLYLVMAGALARTLARRLLCHPGHRECRSHDDT